MAPHDGDMSLGHVIGTTLLMAYLGDRVELYLNMWKLWKICTVLKGPNHTSFIWKKLTNLISVWKSLLFNNEPYLFLIEYAIIKLGVNLLSK